MDFQTGNKYISHSQDLEIMNLSMSHKELQLKVAVDFMLKRD